VSLVIGGSMTLSWYFEDERTPARIEVLIGGSTGAFRRCRKAGRCPIVFVGRQQNLDFTPYEHANPIEN
jgi:hypothetical protein